MMNKRVLVATITGKTVMVILGISDDKVTEEMAKAFT